MGSPEASVPGSPVVNTSPMPAQSSEQLLFSLREIQKDFMNLCNLGHSRGASIVSERQDLIAEELAKLRDREYEITALETSPGGWLTVKTKKSSKLLQNCSSFTSDFAIFLFDEINYLLFCEPHVRDARMLSYRASATAADFPDRCSSMWEALRQIKTEFLELCNQSELDAGSTGIERHVELAGEYCTLKSQLQDLTGMKPSKEAVVMVPTHITRKAFREESSESLYFANHVYNHVLFRFLSHMVNLQSLLSKLSPQ